MIISAKSTQNLQMKLSNLEWKTLYLLFVIKIMVSFTKIILLLLLLSTFTKREHPPLELLLVKPKNSVNNLGLSDQFKAIEYYETCQLLQGNFLKLN